MTSTTQNGLNARTALILLTAILALAAFMRLNQLGFPSVWIDELNHHYAAQTYIENGKMTLPSGQPNERAYFYSVMVAWTFEILGPTSFALRFPSALFGIFCVWLAWFIATRFFDRVTAFYTALFVAISPFAIGWSRISRFYTLFQFLFMLGVYLFYLGFEEEGKGRVAQLQNKLLDGPLQFLKTLVRSWNINLVWIIISLPVLFFAYKIHDLTALFPIGLLFYCGMMLVVVARKKGVKQLFNSKYLWTAVCIIVGLGLAIAVLEPIREKVLHGMNYAPKWAENTRFQNRMLHIDFLFDKYHFPTGLLFFVGALLLVSRMHKAGIYALALFIAPVFLFMFVFSYGHFQYIFNVYSFFTMIAAYCFASFVSPEIKKIGQSWVGKKTNKSVVTVAVLLLFIVWLPLAPSARLAKNIPFQPDGSYNGAMYLEEWQEATQFVKKQLRPDDLLIASDALGVLFELGRVDYDLNFADYDLAKVENLVRDDGTLFDLYSGAPFVTSIEQLQGLFEKHDRVWLLFQHYKLLEATVFTPKPLRDFILSNTKEMLKTENGTVLVYFYEKPIAGEQRDDLEIGQGGIH